MNRQELFNKNIKLAYRLANNVNKKSYMDRDDLTQDSLLILWRLAGRYLEKEPDCAFTTYFMRNGFRDLTNISKRYHDHVNPLFYYDGAEFDGEGVSEDIIEELSVEYEYTYLDIRRVNKMARKACYNSKYLPFIEALEGGKQIADLCKEMGVTSSTGHNRFNKIVELTQETMGL